MPGAAFATGDRVTLRTVESEDARFIRDHSNDPLIRESTTLDRPRNLDSIEEHITGDTDDLVQFLVRLDDEPAGIDGAHVRRGGARPRATTPSSPWASSCCSTSTSARATRRSRTGCPLPHTPGYGTEAAALGLDYAFDHRRLRRVNARLRHERPSIGLLEKLGSVHEGTQRGEKFVDGEYVDTRLCGLLVDEWREARSGLDVALDD